LPDNAQATSSKQSRCSTGYSRKGPAIKDIIASYQIGDAISYEAKSGTYRCTYEQCAKDTYFPLTIFINKGIIVAARDSCQK